MGYRFSPQWERDPRLNTEFLKQGNVTVARRMDKNKTVFGSAPLKVSDVGVQKKTGDWPLPKPSPTPSKFYNVPIPPAKGEGRGGDDGMELDKWWDRITALQGRLEGERFAREREAFDRGASFNTARDVFGLFGGIVQQGLR